MTAGSVSASRDWKRYLELGAALAGQEFPGAYRGNLTGALAAIAVPLATVATYAFVFSRLIPVRIRPGQSTTEYALFLLAGLVVWNLVADVVVRSPRLFAASAHYVHRARFPISLVVIAPCLASFYRALPWWLAYGLAHAWLYRTLPKTFFAAPLVLVFTMGIAIGLALAIASIGAVVRDLGDALPPIVSLAFFVSPILYPASRLGEVSEWLVRLNPMAAPIQIMRALVFEGALPEQALLVQLAVATTLCLAIGVLAYRLVRTSLQDLV